MILFVPPAAAASSAWRKALEKRRRRITRRNAPTPFKPRRAQRAVRRK